MSPSMWTENPQIYDYLKQFAPGTTGNNPASYSSKPVFCYTWLEETNGSEFMRFLDVCIRFFLFLALGTMQAQISLSDFYGPSHARAAGAREYNLIRNTKQPLTEISYSMITFGMVSSLMLSKVWMLGWMLEFHAWTLYQHSSYNMMSQFIVLLAGMFFGRVIWLFTTGQAWSAVSSNKARALSNLSGDITTGVDDFHMVEGSFVGTMILSIAVLAVCRVVQLTIAGTTLYAVCGFVVLVFMVLAISMDGASWKSNGQLYVLWMMAILLESPVLIILCVYDTNASWSGAKLSSRKRNYFDYC